MAKSRNLFAVSAGMILFAAVLMFAKLDAQAGSGSCLKELNGGVAVILEPGNTNTSELINATAKELNLKLERETEEKEESLLVMANVDSVLNVRSEPSEEADKVGRLYKDCGGTIIERGDGWTKIQSGNIIGWAKNDYLLFDDAAKALANDVGRMIATINAEALYVRSGPGTDTSRLGMLPKGEIVEVINSSEEDWVCIDYEGMDGYVSAEYVTLDFQIDAGETLAEIKAREAAEEEAKRHKNYGAFTTDADTTLLLAALIQCEAGGESYEGQVAVGAVVMNRVRSAAYPDTIHGVIYASGQFTPAMSGKVNAVYESGRIYESCINAANEALSGVSNVGDYTHFRRNNGRDGLVIGNHVFY